MSDGAGHRSVEHTADLAFVAWAPSEAGVLVEAASAMIELLLDGAAGPAATHSVSVQLDALDPEDRLVRWLSEVLYRATVDNFVVVAAELTLLPTGLHAKLVGGAATLQTEIKAVTYHDLQLQRRGTQWHARVVFDV